MATTTETKTELIELSPFGVASVDKAGSLRRGSRVAETSDSDHEHNHNNDVVPVLSANEPADATSASSPTSRLRAILVVVDVCAINFLSSFTTGTIVIGLPTIAHSISLSRDLYVWPSSVYGLTSGAALLLAGSVADLIGAKHIELLGTLIVSVFTLACGFATTGIQLVIFRAMQGVGMAMHLSASVALVADSMPQGKGRNISFGCLGLAQPLGFSFGLVISGILIEKLSWRAGFYLCGGGSLLAFVVGIFLLPKPPPESVNASHSKSLLSRLATEIDWFGGLLASTGLALLSYVLAELSVAAPNIAKPAVATLLALSCVALIAFPFWIRHRERNNRPALIPNAIWRKKAFTSTCMMVALTYGSTNAMELFSSLYFQDIQNQSTLFTSLRLLPNCLVGALCNFVVAALVDRLSARWLVTFGSVLSAVAAVLMAVVNPRWPYWYMEIWAQALSPLCADVLFTVGLLVVSREFPEKTQGLAGGVFNTAAQFGMSLGVGLCQLVASLVGGNLEQGGSGKGNMSGNAVGGRTKEHLLHGYQASFWTTFAYCAACVLFAFVGLNKAGKLGVKAS